MLLTLLTSIALAAPQLSGIELFSGKSVQVAYDSGKKKGTVVLFVSAKCPCSTSHNKHLQEMSEKHPDYEFVGIHSNADETLEFTREQFKGQFRFPIIQDEKSKIADEFKALKTPHAYILDRSGKIVYRGGVSSSADCTRSDKFFLKDALDDLEANRVPKVAETRTLGCIITRAK